jgi:hypothetical protein
LSDPASMAGATPEEVLALKPPGWLVRPFPGGHTGFRMVSPGRMPGSLGTISVHGPTSGFRSFPSRPPLRAFLLNCVLEHPLLVEVLASWTGSYGTDDRSSEIPQLAAATENLVRDGLITVHEDDLIGDELRLLPRDLAVRAVADPLNWWRDEDDETVPAANSVYALDITDLGRRHHLGAAGAKPRGRWFRRRA